MVFLWFLPPTSHHQPDHISPFLQSLGPKKIRRFSKDTKVQPPAIESSRASGRLGNGKKSIYYTIYIPDLYRYIIKKHRNPFSIDSFYGIESIPNTKQLFFTLDSECIHYNTVKQQLKKHTKTTCRHTNKNMQQTQQRNEYQNRTQTHLIKTSHSLIYTV